MVEKIIAGFRSRRVGPAELRLLWEATEISPGKDLPEQLLSAGARVTIEQQPNGIATRPVRTEREHP